MLRELIAVLLLIGLSGPAAALGEVVVLSDRSSDSTPPEALDAQVDFAVEGETLTLTVSNLTPPFPWQGGYWIDWILINAGDSVTDLSLAPGDWRLDRQVALPGFGVFDFGLRPRPGIDAWIEGESSLAFTLPITGIGPFLPSDFSTEESQVGEGETPGLVAAYFFNGPSGDDAWGIAVEEAVGAPEAPAAGAADWFRPAGPNPCLGEVSLELTLTEDQGIDVQICDSTGRRVRDLLDDVVGPGRHLLRWDGRDENGTRVAAGVYFACARGSRAGRPPTVRIIRLP